MAKLQRVSYAMQRSWLVITVTLGMLASACALLEPVPAVMTAMPSSTPAPSQTPAALVAAATLTPAPTSAPYKPVFERTTCNFQVPSGAIVDCGFLVVPQDRGGNLADTIRLAVAHYRSPNQVGAGPIVYLQGGPGDAAITSLAGAYSSFIEPLLAQGDVIVFDQRGAGLSQPALSCDEISSVSLSDALHLFPANQRVARYWAAFLACRDRLTSNGARLAAYTTAASAADVRDLAAALGYQQINLYGVSYGTRLAQAVMRAYPGLVRSAVLDSVVPLELKVYNTTTAASDEALQALFNGCAADPTCAAAYPDLGQVFAGLVAQLNTQPLVVKTADVSSGSSYTTTVNGTDLTGYLLWAMQSSDYIPAIPQSLYRLKKGDASFLSPLAALPQASDSVNSLGDLLSINCHEQIFATTAAELDASLAGHPTTSALSLVASFGGETLYSLCQAWGAAPFDPHDSQPLSSDIPTLLFAGSYDPITRPANAQQLAARLTHGTVVEFPGMSHALSFGAASQCPLSIALSFLANPSAPPKSDCLGQVTASRFTLPLTSADQVPLEPFTNLDYGLNGLEPSGWKDVGSGFCYRLSSPLDPTQLGLQTAQSSVADWLKWVTDKWANRGLDAPPKPAGQRQAGGFTWRLYTASFQGNPVDLAFSVSGHTTIMVGMVSAPDEHAALLKLVFGPVIEAIKLGQ